MPTYFTPGNKSYSKRIINYTAVYNELRLKQNSLNYLPLESTNCDCKTSAYNKGLKGSSSSSQKLPQNINISQIVNTYLGGKIQFGNFYLNQPLNVNYFGRVEGMPGGFGSPPLNKF